MTKKCLVLFSFFVFFNASFFNPILDQENIDIDISRLDGENISIEWSVAYENYDTIIIEISHDNNIEKYQLPGSSGKIELCCYPDYVKITISVFITKIEDYIGPDCNASECKTYI